MRPLRPVTTTRSVGKLTGRTRALERRDVGSAAAVAGWNLLTLPGDNDWDWVGGTSAKPAWKLNPNPGKQPFLRGAWDGGESGTSPGTLPSEAGAPFDDDFVTALAFTTVVDGQVGLAITKVDVDGVITIYTFSVGVAGDVSFDPTGSDLTSEDVQAALLELEAQIVALSSVYQAKDTTLTTYAGIDPSSNVQSILGATNYAAIRTLLGLVVGTNVEAHDADLTTIAGLSPSNDDLLQRKSGGWTNRTIAQLLTDLAAAGTTFQPLDSDLTSLAALTTTSYGRALLTLANVAALYTALSVDTDGTLATNSDTKLASQKAIKTYVDANVGGGGSVAAEDVSIIDTGGYFTGTDVEAALQELGAGGGGGGGGDPVSPGFKTGGAYYFMPPGAGTVGTLTTTLALLQATPVYLPAGITIDRIGIRVTGGSGLGTLLRLGIYANTDGLPGALILDAGTVAANSVAHKEITVSQAISTAGWYWLVGVAQTAGGAIVSSIPGIGFPSMWNTFSSPLQTTFAGYSLAGVTGALPNPLGSPPFTMPTEALRLYVRVT